MRDQVDMFIVAGDFVQETNMQYIMEAIISLSLSRDILVNHSSPLITIIKYDLPLTYSIRFGRSNTLESLK